MHDSGTCRVSTEAWSACSKMGSESLHDRSLWAKPHWKMMDECGNALIAQVMDCRTCVATTTASVSLLLVNTEQSKRSDSTPLATPSCESAPRQLRQWDRD